jgi:hypothetical protein
LAMEAGAGRETSTTAARMWTEQAAIALATLLRVAMGNRIRRAFRRPCGGAALPRCPPAPALREQGEVSHEEEGPTWRIQRLRNLHNSAAIALLVAPACNLHSSPTQNVPLYTRRNNGNQEEKSGTNQYPCSSCSRRQRLVQAQLHQFILLKMISLPIAADGGPNMANSLSKLLTARFMF